MAVEIKELIIRAVVKENTGGKKSGPSLGLTKEKQESIVRECVDQVMQILKDKSYR